LSLICLAVSAGVWRMYAFRTHPPRAATTLVSAPGQPPLDAAQRTVISNRSLQPRLAIDPSAARRKATDYLQLVKLLLPTAKEGSPAAQYEVAKALKYCDQNWHASSFFSPKTGVPRTSDEMQQLFTKLPENTQSLLKVADRRCRSFLEDLPLLKTANDWLDQAAKAGYAPATFMKADMAMKSHLMDGDTAAIQRAREQAIIASASGDPEVLAGMVDFVESGNRNPQQVGQLISAWWLLACNSGYDCSANSEVAKGFCTVDAQCANKVSLLEDLERVNGAKFGEVQLLSEQIGAAIGSRDPELIRKYL
jgi:TPR repeat protein